MTDFTCPECKDTGVYQGLNTVEPCRACGGKKPGSDWPGFSRSLTRKVMDPRFVGEILRDAESHAIADVCQQFAIPQDVLSGGQSIRHELEEQVAEPVEVHLKATEQSILEVHCDTREIDFFGTIRHELVYRKIDLLGFIYSSQEDCERIGEAYLSQSPVKVTCCFQDGSTSSVVAFVSGWHVTFKTMEGSLFLIEGAVGA